MQFRLEVKISVLLIALVLLFQFFAGIYFNQEIGCIYNLKISSQLHINSVHAGITDFQEVGRKLIFSQEQSGVYGNIKEVLDIICISNNRSICSVVSVDNRKVIKLTIPHYFHGSKYKGISMNA